MCVYLVLLNGYSYDKFYIQGRSQATRKAVEDAEQRMLDEIEASTARTYQMVVFSQ